MMPALTLKGSNIDRTRLLLVPLLTVTLLGACSDEKRDEGPTEPHGLMVLNSDYQSSRVTFAAPDRGLVTRESCIDSGTRAPGLSVSLSGDVALPSRVRMGDALVVIDMTNSALTWIDPRTCAVLRQLAVGTGFFANPHDVVAVSAEKAYVLRHSKNANPTADPGDFDEGDDLLSSDPTKPAITGRISMSEHATSNAVEAKPERGVLVGDKLYVTLGNLSGDFNTAAEGRIVIVDVATDTVTGTIELPGLKGCSGLDVLPDESKLVVVCGGAFSDGPTKGAGSGVVLVDLQVTPPSVSGELRAAAFSGRIPAPFAFAAFDENTGFVVTLDPAGTGPDELWMYNRASATTAKLRTGTESFSYRGMTADRAQRRGYLADATKAEPRVHVYEWGNTEPVTSFVSDPASGLPPLAVGWF